MLSQFVFDPRQSHREAAIRVLRYPKTTLGQWILLPKEGGTKLIAYNDSDWLGCPFFRISWTIYLLILGGTPISWKSKKQSVVSRSSTKVEYRAMATTVSEILWIWWLLANFDVHINEPTPLLCDNESACHIADNPIFHEHTKHIEMDCYFVRECDESKEIIPIRITTHDQLADPLTKSLGSKRLHSLLIKLGIRNLHASAWKGVNNRSYP